MFQLDENVNPNIMTATILLGSNHVNGNSNVSPIKKNESIGLNFNERFSKKRPFELTQYGSPLRERKLTVSHNSLQTTSLLSSPSKVLFQQGHDTKVIEEALGGTQQSNVECFEKEYGHSFQAIVNATLLELAVIRRSKLTSMGFGGFKQAGIKKWKFFVKLDDNGNITQLFIGKFKDSGTFTKVYFTPNRQVMLVPRMSLSDSIIQAQQAYTLISNLHSVHSKRAHYLENSIAFLPPLPKRYIVGSRPIMIAPEATCAKNRYRKSPKDLPEIIERLEIIRDVARGLKYCFEISLIHGDIKPANLLISQSGKGQLNDFGGGCSFSGEESPKEAAVKYHQISFTAFYTHYQDYLTGKQLIVERADVHRFVQLGGARDVFSLGVSLIDILMGMYSEGGRKVYPFQASSYHTCDKLKASFPTGDFDSCRNLTCMELIPIPVREKLQKLLRSCLEKNYMNRISASECAEELDSLIVELKNAMSC